MVTIDGSQGEGGGQVLRSALTLSILTGQELLIENIRARRSKPGLLAQHLKSVDAAAAVSKAEVEGASFGSTRLAFHPKEIRSGRYRLDIGTAGATTLVLQTVFLPLSRASSSSTLIITGGTHVSWSPSFHYLDLLWIPFLLKIGFDAQVSLDQAGFYPQGGGRISATIRPAAEITPLSILERGKLQTVTILSAIANLDLSIADRQKRQAIQRLDSFPSEYRPQTIKMKTLQLPSPVKGTILLLLAEFEQTQCCYYALGEPGKPAEQVANEAADALLQFLQSTGTVDQYLADQLLLPLSLANGPSIFRTNMVTEHLLTNASVIRAFLPLHIDISGNLGSSGIVRIGESR
jgi:RNA 3'-terminal phosphate cyclase (ATP)